LGVYRINPTPSCAKVRLGWQEGNAQGEARGREQDYSISGWFHLSHGAAVRSNAEFSWEEECLLSEEID